MAWDEREQRGVLRKLQCVPDGGHPQIAVVTGCFPLVRLAKNREIPCIIPCYRESIPESGSLQTASTATPLLSKRSGMQLTLLMFDPNAHMLRINRGMIYLGACLIAGLRLAGTNR